MNTDYFTSYIINNPKMTENISNDYEGTEDYTYCVKVAQEFYTNCKKIAEILKLEIPEYNNTDNFLHPILLSGMETVLIALPVLKIDLPNHLFVPLYSDYVFYTRYINEIELNEEEVFNNIYKNNRIFSIYLKGALIYINEKFNIKIKEYEYIPSILGNIKYLIQLTDDLLIYLKKGNYV